MQSIFRRQAETYVENPDLAAWILADVANPLNQISRLIDHGAVLDIGCGTGILGRLLKDKAGVTVDGVDPAVSADNADVKSYRHFFSCGVEEVIATHGIDQYDWIVMADVIEHFSYPDEILATLAKHAKPDACFLLSTPNIAHLSVRLGLLDGRFDYVESGILESTHLRFFTLNTLKRVLNSAGLSAVRVVLLNRLPSPNELMGLGWLRALMLPLIVRRDEAVTTFQFLAVARKMGKVDQEPELQHVGQRNLWICYASLARLYASKLKRFLLGRR